MIFNELSNFTKRVVALMDDDSYAKLQITLYENPNAGKIIKGSGGLRKIRWAAKSRGKRGGFRIIYYWWIAASVITFCDIYAKNEKEDLTRDEIEKLRRQLEG